MFKRRYKTAAISAGLLAMASSMPVAASGALTLVNEFEKNGAKVYVLAGEGCELPELPGINIPGWPDNNQPDQPEPEAPDNGQPDQLEPEAPDNGQPDQPESETPDNQPDQPESEAPDNGQPDQPEPETPDNGQPDQPETEKPGQGTENQSFAMQVIHLVNQERAKEGLPALTYDAEIEQAALVRAKETEKSFSHTRPDGRSFSTALTDAGVTFRGSGENIAYGQKSPEQVMKGWMNSPGHRANIMNEKFTKIGVGYYQNSNGVNYWTQLFTY